jgi:2-polyprenyl-3-methyl-5-hydroxy-6-metoxy-1,4-benzoquinol methylase
MRDWGRILVSTRLEKQVSAKFFQVWEKILQHGLRAGDGALSMRGMVAHKAQNELVRRFLASGLDTLLTLDSDADVEPDFLERFRTHGPGQEFDILQAFYCRRGWPMRAIWMKRNALGQLTEYYVTDPDKTEEVDMAGTHACLFRREVFERMLGDNDQATFEWFHYPRHSDASEDGAFSAEAQAAGFRIGATTAIRAGHISEITTTWDMYQDQLHATGQMELLERHSRLCKEIAEFTGETVALVSAKSMQGHTNVRDEWNELQPQTAEDERAFYGGTFGYFYDLLAWNTSAGYQRIIAPLKEVRNKRVLVIGTGLGIEAELLADANDVYCYDVPGYLQRFAEQRLGNKAAWLLKDPEQHASKFPEAYDLIVAIDTLEHIHPAEIDETLDAIGGLLKPGGILYAHNNWNEQDKYPMHHDHSDTFACWLNGSGMKEIGNLQWRKNSKSLATTETVTYSTALAM